MADLEDEITKEAEETYKKVDEQEKEGVKGIHKHFDRIHDKLFAFNNLMIIGYFAMAKFVTEPVSIYFIIAPLMNLMLLIFIEYRMMEFHRFSSDYSNRTLEEIQENGKESTKTTLYSLLSIAATLIVAILFFLMIILK